MSAQTIIPYLNTTSLYRLPERVEDYIQRRKTVKTLRKRKFVKTSSRNNLYRVLPSFGAFLTLIRNFPGLWFKEVYPVLACVAQRSPRDITSIFIYVFTYLVFLLLLQWPAQQQDICHRGRRFWRNASTRRIVRRLYSTSGAGTNLLVARGHRSGAKRRIFFSVVPLHSFGSKSTISRFSERFRDGQYSLVSFLFVVLLLTVPPVPSHL